MSHLASEEAYLAPIFQIWKFLCIFRLFLTNVMGLMYFKLFKAHFLGRALLIYLLFSVILQDSVFGLCFKSVLMLWAKIVISWYSGKCIETWFQKTWILTPTPPLCSICKAFNSLSLSIFNCIIRVVLIPKLLFSDNVVRTIGNNRYECSF